MAHQNESEVPTDSGVDHKDAGKSLPRDVETDFFCVLFCCPLIYPSKVLGVIHQWITLPVKNDWPVNIPEIQNFRRYGYVRFSRNGRKN